MKVYLENSWKDEIERLLSGSSEEFELELKQTPELSIDKIPWWKKISFRREPAVGGPMLEGLIPLLQQGVDVFLEVRNSYTYIILELWSLYDFIHNKSLEKKAFFQTVTDYVVGESGDIPIDKKSVTFIWPLDLDEEQFKNLAERVEKTRKFIYEIMSKLDEDTAKQINHVECKVAGGEWKINIVNKKALETLPD